MAKKDPAFLFYSKDWLEGTAEMMPNEKGVYIDLLSYQHQRKGLPTETVRLAKMVGLSHEQFLEIWKILQSKFNHVDNRLVNEKLMEVMDERACKGRKNKINGTFAGVLRKGNYSNPDRDMLKTMFKSEDFMDCPDDELTKWITTWITERLA
jgi:uncharacterized protein YdaU (DUF1376 family)